MLLRHNSRYGSRTEFSRALTRKPYRELREIAEQLHRPAIQLGREAIESWLKEARRAAIAEAIQAYAEHIGRIL